MLDFKIGRPASNSLVRDYLAGEGRCRDFLPADWRAAEAYLERARALDSEDRDGGWAEAVRTHGPVGAERLEAVIREGGYVVTTGQQPGLFSGPLYSVWKGLTAARLADRLAQVTGKPVLPLFWVASEDHDWDETDHTWIVGVDNDLHRVELTSVEGAGDAPLFRLDVGAQMADRLDEVRSLLPDTDVAEAEAMDRLRDAWLPGDSRTVTLASGFERLLGPLLDDFGVAFVQAHAPGLKARSAPVLREGWRRAAEIEEQMQRRAEALEEAGYPVQVPILEGAVNLFLEADGRRERLYREGDDFALRHAGTRYSDSELDEILESSPDRLSPNVHLRPVVEAAVFPTLAYVAGPGELTYYAQLAPLYETLGVGMPVVHPRFGVTLYESKVTKVLEKFAVEEESLHRPFHEIAQDFAREEVPEEVRQALGRIRGAIGEGSSELTEAAREIDPTLKGPIGSARGAAFAAFADAEKAILKAVKRESEITLQQLEKARLHLFPDGVPQERRMNLVYYLARYGARFLHEVFDAMEIELQGTGTGARL